MLNAKAVFQTICCFLFLLISLSIASAQSNLPLFDQKLRLIPSDGGTGRGFGSDIAVSADGNTLVVGAAEDDDQGLSSGSVYVFVRSGTSWTEQAKLLAQDGSAGDRFGHSVSLSADGNTLVVGAIEDDDQAENSGSVYVFVRNGTIWSAQAKLLASDGAGFDRFGVSVDISADGNTVVVRESKTLIVAEERKAYVFVRSGIIWDEQAKLIIFVGFPEFRDRIALSADGNTVVVGASSTDSAYVFVRNGTSWTEQAELSDPDGSGGGFGSAVDISADGNMVVVGERNNDNQGVRSGSVFVFVRNGTTWSEQAELSDPGGSAGDRFGQSVSVNADGNTLVVGATGDDDQAENSGSVYVFARNGTIWNEREKLFSLDGTLPYGFGASTSVSADGNTVGITSSFGSSPRSPYVFWSTQATPIANDLVLNLPSGVFTVFNDNTSASLLHGETAEAVATADVDGNGEDDVIVSFPSGTGPTSSGGTWISRNQGALTLLDSKTALRIAVGDLDGSGLDDLMLDFGADGLWLGIDDNPPFLLIDLPPDAMAIGDLDNNGLDDMVLSFTGFVGFSTFYVLNFTDFVVLDSAVAETLATADVDGNGEDDVIVSFPGAGTFVSRNQGALTQLDTKTAEQITKGDFDGSGQEDLLLDFGADNLWLGLNDTSPTQFIDLPLVSMASGDLDNNGLDDMVLSLTGVGTLMFKNLVTLDLLDPAVALDLATGNVDGN